MLIVFFCSYFLLLLWRFIINDHLRTDLAAEGEMVANVVIGLLLDHGIETTTTIIIIIIIFR